MIHKKLKKRLIRLIIAIREKLFNLFNGDYLSRNVEPQIFKLRTQLLSKGRSEYLLARTETMGIKIKCYAQGGENALHTHPGQDHTFIVLAGKAKFYGVDDDITELNRNQGILIPEGLYHYFSSCGEEPLVMMRISARKRLVLANRIGLDGKPFMGQTEKNNYEKPVPIEGVYYE